MHTTGTAQRGFTLIEISIVLVIIGLIVGGILVGQTLIKAAQNRTIIREKDQIETAVMTFRDKYGGLPGDLPNATQFWGTEAGGWCPSNDPTHPLTAGSGTCNGNGDMQIDGDNTCTYKPCPFASNGEYLYFWHHLALAGLSPFGFQPEMGVYAGLGTDQAGLSSWIGFPGQNIPQSATGLGGWYVSYLNSDSTTRLWGNGACSNSGLTGFWAFSCWNGHVLMFSGTGAILDRAGWPGVLPPSQAQAIDLKIDDGQPDSGNVHGGWGGYGVGLCAIPAPTFGRMIYNPTDGQDLCPLLFTTNF